MTAPYTWLLWPHHGYNWFATTTKRPQGFKKEPLYLCKTCHTPLGYRNSQRCLVCYGFSVSLFSAALRHGVKTTFFHPFPVLSGAPCPGLQSSLTGHQRRPSDKFQCLWTAMRCGSSLGELFCQETCLTLPKFLCELEEEIVQLYSVTSRSPVEIHVLRSSSQNSIHHRSLGLRACQNACEQRFSTQPPSLLSSK